MKKRLLCTTLSVLMVLSLTVPARAADLPFRDVTPANWFYTPVSELYNIQLVNGVSADSFDPGGTVSLGQALKLILGMVIVIALREGGKAVFGKSLVVYGVLHFVLVVFAGIVWPMTFKWFAKLGKK